MLMAFMRMEWAVAWAASTSPSTRPSTAKAFDISTLELGRNSQPATSSSHPRIEPRSGDDLAGGCPIKVNGRSPAPSASAAAAASRIRRGRSRGRRLLVVPDRRTAMDNEIPVGLIIRQKDPNNLEMPFDQLGDFITPSELFYIRSHFRRT